MLPIVEGGDAGCGGACGGEYGVAGSLYAAAGGGGAYGAVLLIGCLASIALSLSTIHDWISACVFPPRMVAQPIRVSAPAASAELLARLHRPEFERVAPYA